MCMYVPAGNAGLNLPTDAALRGRACAIGRLHGPRLVFARRRECRSRDGLMFLTSDGLTSRRDAMLFPARAHGLPCAKRLAPACKPRIPGLPAGRIVAGFPADGTWSAANPCPCSIMIHAARPVPLWHAAVGTADSWSSPGCAPFMPERCRCFLRAGSWWSPSAGGVCRSSPDAASNIFPYPPCSPIGQ
ncbi:hypothetical protein CC78DRAFT_108629 [Lojkania enalia]|uniref:Uncharacterized protein n=1 Tax=Lojkania enalia TaxID=147567 RepID=A0A9P4N8V8_9PLEO|nr:hypothetical protein CC78DRAFT_108629 [Didymosphaeria enalia]